MSDLIQATSRTVKTMADGTLRLTVDISPIHAQNAFTLFGMPDAPVVLARLTQEAAQENAQQETIEADKPKGGPLSTWLALRNKEPEFWAFVAAKSYGSIFSEIDCDRAVKLFLGIKSKIELDNDAEAEERFHSMVRLPFAQWLAGAR